MTDTSTDSGRRARLLELTRERAWKDNVDVTLASGKRSTFYVKGKEISLHPEGLNLCARLMLEQLEEFPEITAIGGLTMGADPIAGAICALSWDLGRPLDAFLVRKEPKGHGLGSAVEGTLHKGQKVAVLEDTITTGGSARKAVDAVKALGAEPMVILALADRLDPDGDGFREEFDVRPLFNVNDLRGEAN